MRRMRIKAPTAPPTIAPIGVEWDPEVAFTLDARDPVALEDLEVELGTWVEIVPDIPGRAVEFECDEFGEFGRTLVVVDVEVGEPPVDNTFELDGDDDDDEGSVTKSWTRESGVVLLFPPCTT